MINGFRHVSHRAACVALLLAAAALLPASAAGPRFFADDPLKREPDSQNASAVREWDIDLFIDLAINMFGRPGDPAEDVRARNVNTIDEVPDSNWFTNRILPGPLTPADLSRGPLVGDGPAPGTWTLVSRKVAGFAPGFTMRDSRGEIWFVSFDADGHPEAATGAIMVANKIFWALGYWQVENFLVSVVPEQIVIAESATFTPPSGRERRMEQRDLDDVFKRSHRGTDGRYRAVAARGLRGRTIGGFRYYGTRPDDPNDVVPHEHRRELRALKVFGAWTNLVDMKAGNTLDTVIEENGRSVVRHYLQDVGSTFGTGANGPREYDEGWELLLEPDLVKKRLLRLGFFFQPWQTVKYDDNPAIGRFEGDEFDPLTWKPRVATAAFLRARADDNFWAARRVAAFTDDMIRAAVKTARYSDESAEALLSDVLIKRRQKIVRGYIPAINPLYEFALSADGAVTFRNAAVDLRVGDSPAAGYRASWLQFDNTTGQTRSLGPDTTSRDTRLMPPAPLPDANGTFVKLQVSSVEPAQAEWLRPVDVYFTKTAGGWRLIGLERLA
jgi:hypothetical protein